MTTILEPELPRGRSHHLLIPHFLQSDNCLPGNVYERTVQIMRILEDMPFSVLDRQEQEALSQEIESRVFR